MGIFKCKDIQNILKGASISGLLGLIAFMMISCGNLADSGDPAAIPGPPLLNTPPVFTSESNFTSYENITKVATITAGDSENNTLVFSIDGGADSAHFQIDSQSGELRFVDAPDFEMPLDDNTNNTYVVEIAASDGIYITRQTFVVAVIDYLINVTVPVEFVKTLNLSWPAVAQVKFYKLYIGSDAESDAVQVGVDIDINFTEVKLPVHFTDWSKSRLRVEGYNDQGLVFRSDPTTIHAVMLDSIGYFKASNTGKDDNFGHSLALSGDGKTLAIGAPRESSAATGIDGEQSDNSLESAGAVYVYTWAGAEWEQQAYIKASNTDARDEFGSSVALSADGQTLVVGALGESSAAKGVDGDQSNNTADRAGAVYVYTRADTPWTQQAYIKASNSDANDGFGSSVALSANGQMLIVGAWGEDSAAVGINGDQSDDTANDTGAVYTFVRTGETWAQQAYIKASNTDDGDFFGDAVALSADGQILAVGAWGENSATTGVNGDQGDNFNADSGAVYIYARSGLTWTQQAYIKASNTSSHDFFGTSVALNENGEILVVGAPEEDGSTTGIGGDQSDNAAASAGAVYVYNRAGTLWTQQDYIKASNAATKDFFGTRVALSADGQKLAVGAWGENSSALGVNGDQSDDTAADSGAVYVFTRTEAMWVQRAYVKATNTGAGDSFGFDLALSADAQTLVVGAREEDSAAVGINGTKDDNSISGSGAVYLY